MTAARPSPGDGPSPRDAPADLVLVSDLHLGAGYDRERLAWDPLEPFFYDDAFARFLDHLVARASEQRPVRLVVLGDLLDFRLVDPRPEPDDAPTHSAETAAAAVGTIGRGHPGVFAALGRFLSAGFSIDIVVGNHDVELGWPAVQRALRQVLLADGHGHSCGEVRFHRWIYYLPGLLYAEHGHQYQDLEAFATVLNPYSPEDPDEIAATLGALLYRRLLDLDLSLDPCPDHETPPWRYFRLAARGSPASLLGTVPAYGHLLAELVRRSGQLSRSEGRARQGYARTLAHYAGEIGLPADVVRDLDALSAASARSPAMRLLRALAPPTRILGAGTAMALMATGLRRPRRLAAGASVASGAAVVRTSRLRSAHPGTGRYLARAALEIHGVLRSRALGVPAYVFGHSHEAQHLPLAVGPEAPQYLNTGTWSSLAATTRQPLRSPFWPTFVQISAASRPRPPTARLLLWNDALQTVEPLRTQA